MLRCCLSILIVAIGWRTGLAQAEKYFSVIGKVVDSDSNQPLPYANIYIKGKTIGTVSNDIGDFEFNIPDALKTDTLIISYVGYKDYKSVLSIVPAKVFRLEQSVTQLSVIEVIDSSPQEIVRKAIKNIEKNYPTRPYLLKGFFRDWKITDSINPDSSNVTLLEAAVTIYDKGYQSKKTAPLREEVFLDEIRRSQSSGHIYNYLHFLLLQNFVSYKNSKNIGGVYSPFDFDHLEEFEIKDIITQGSDVLYFITASLPDRLGKYELYIAAKDLALVRINFKGEISGENVLGKDPQPTLHRTHQLIFIDNTLVFHRHQEKYFLNYIKLNWKVRTLSDSNKEITSKREFWQELLVNEIVTTNVEEDKKTHKFRMLPSASLESQTRPYNASFWKNFNVIKDNPLNLRLIKLLEKNEKIEDQFVLQKADSSKFKKTESKKKQIKRS